MLILAIFIGLFGFEAGMVLNDIIDHNIDAIAAILILFVPYPNMIYIYIIMVYAYSMEVFYQMVKRKQKFPIAQNQFLKLINSTNLKFYMSRHLNYKHKFQKKKI